MEFPELGGSAAQLAQPGRKFSITVVLVLLLTTFFVFRQVKRDATFAVFTQGGREDSDTCQNKRESVGGGG